MIFINILGSVRTLLGGDFIILLAIAPGPIMSTGVSFQTINECLQCNVYICVVVTLSFFTGLLLLNYTLTKSLPSESWSISLFNYFFVYL